MSSHKIRDRIKYVLLNYLFILLLFFTNVNSQSLNGLAGYFNIPSADIKDDGTLILGAGFLPFEYLKEKNYDTDAAVFFAGITFLPFIEGGVRFTKHLRGGDALGDRMFLVKVRLLNEKYSFVSAAVGAQDFIHSTDNLTNRFNSLYAVITKNIKLGKFFNSLSLTGGYGSDIMDAGSYEYKGWFGGVKIRIVNSFDLMCEYDGKYINAGTRIDLFNLIFFSLGVIDGKYAAGLGGIKLSL